MASKVLVPTAFNKIQVKKTPPPDTSPGFLVTSDSGNRVAHLEHSIRFLQEQHRLMLSGLHAEIEALRERNRDLQFQLIFNKESAPKTSPTPDAANVENSEEDRLKKEISRLEQEAAAARGEARAAEARSLQLQRLVDAQTDKIRELEACACREESEASGEGRAELRARLGDAERLVRRLRSDAERQRRELQCMKNSLQASLRTTGVDPGFGYHNTYHFPPVHTPEFWREPLRDNNFSDYSMMGTRNRNNRRPLTLPELTATGHQIHRATVFANNHARSKPGYENKSKKVPGAEDYHGKTPEEPTCSPANAQEVNRTRHRRHHHRKHTNTEHT